MILNGASKLMLRLQGVEFTRDGPVVSFKLFAYREEAREEVSIAVLEQRVTYHKLADSERPDLNAIIGEGARKLKKGLDSVLDALSLIEG